MSSNSKHSSDENCSTDAVAKDGLEVIAILTVDSDSSGDELMGKHVVVVVPIDRPDDEDRDRVAVEADHRFAAVILNNEVSAELSIVAETDRLEERLSSGISNSTGLYSQRVPALVARLVLLRL